ncbi:MAG TPA: hypothetical protein VGV92_05540 [Gammaproteobacteria bacterium]|nr:hypothetical protein [Gammaproteobacteria bacterium]
MYYKESKALVEYTAIYNGFPLVFSMIAGSGYQIEAILESLKEPGKLQAIQRSFLNVSANTPHIYFHLIHRGSVYEGVHAEVSDYAKKRGNMCLDATPIQLVHREQYPQWAGEKIVGWTFASSGTTFKGIAPEAILDVLALIDQKVSAAKNHPVVQNVLYQAEIEQQWTESKKQFGYPG